MAYMNQERKAQIQPKVNAVLRKYGVKGTMAVRDHRTLVLNISEGPIDFIGNSNETRAKDIYQIANGVQPCKDYIDVNTYHYDKHFSGVAKEFLDKIMAFMNYGNHDRSDSQSDYFDVGWYVDINIGRWNKPYRHVA